MNVFFAQVGGRAAVSLVNKFAQALRDDEGALDLKMKVKVSYGRCKLKELPIQFQPNGKMDCLKR